MATKLIIAACATLMIISCNDSVKLVEQADNPRLFKGKISTDKQQKQVDSSYQISFPLDHLSHPEYSIEWWYLTANLFDSSGNQYPIQWTLFRFLNDKLTTNATDQAWSNGQLYMAHARLISDQQNWFEERFGRGGVGNAGVELSGAEGNQFAAYLDDWVWQSESPELLPASLTFTLDSSINVSLTLDALPNYVLHGENGFSNKLADGQQVSMYYSEPFIKVSGTLEIPRNGKKESIVVNGQGWFDHEWSSQLIDRNSLGWDWLSLHLDDGRKLMLFNMRHAVEGSFWSGTLIESDGQSKHLQQSDIQAEIIEKTQLNDRHLPLHWRIKLLDQDVDISLAPFKADQWSFSTFEYYEGAVNISGSSSGHGFIELTGY